MRPIMTEMYNQTVGQKSKFQGFSSGFQLHGTCLAKPRTGYIPIVARLNEHDSPKYKGIATIIHEVYNPSVLLRICLPIALT